MKTLRILLVAAMVVATLAVAPAALAAGKAPGGNGLYFLTDDYHFSNLVCDDATVDDFLVARGGNAGWFVDGSDRLYVLTRISGDVTVTSPDQSTETYSFSQSYGMRSGKTDRVTCTADFGHEHDGVAEDGEMEFVLARIW